MSTRIVIDTQFVVALINTRDEQHDRALELSSTLAGRRFLVTDTVLVEIGNALARGFRQDAAEVIEEFLASSDVEIVRLNEPLFLEALALYKSRMDKDWGMADCISFVVMQRSGILEALTFDQHFVQAGFRALMRE